MLLIYDATILLFYYSTILLFYYSTTILLFYYYSTVLLFYYSSILLFYYSTIHVDRPLAARAYTTHVLMQSMLIPYDECTNIEHFNSNALYLCIHHMGFLESRYCDYLGDFNMFQIFELHKMSYVCMYKCRVFAFQFKFMFAYLYILYTIPGQHKIKYFVLTGHRLHVRILHTY